MTISEVRPVGAASSLLRTTATKQTLPEPWWPAGEHVAFAFSASRAAFGVYQGFFQLAQTAAQVIAFFGGGLQFAFSGF